ncbi:MAG: GNAT family N-acetyltransferase, partial [Bacteroidota bacterium]
MEEGLHIRGLDFQVMGEFQIYPPLKKQIAHLLQLCFDGYPTGRIYLKQLPSFRILCFSEKKLIGHIAVEHRMMNNDGQIVSVFGLTDVCVHVQFQHHRVATRMIDHLTQLAQERAIDFLVLMAQEVGFYKRLGFLPVNNKCQWVMI